MEEIKLLPCPICGGTQISPTLVNHCMVCESCQATGPLARSAGEAKILWNFRSGRDEKGAEWDEGRMKEKREPGPVDADRLAGLLCVELWMEQVAIVGIRRKKAYLLAYKKTRSDAETVKDKKLVVKCLNDYFIYARKNTNAIKETLSRQNSFLDDPNWIESEQSGKRTIGERQ